MVKKAVFPVAGFGTRFLPATKAMPKELLPIVDKPLIQFAAEEAVASGIDTLIFVTGRNKRAIEDHFDRNKELELALVKTGKVEQAKMVANILPQGIECIFVRQPEQLGLGHAVLCAERVVGNEPFAVLLADDFIVDNETTTLTSMIDAYYKSEKSQISVIEVKGADISNYGVVRKSSRDGKITGIVEKPTESEAPSNLASIGRYVLNPKIFARLRALGPGRNDEIQLADALNSLAKDEELEAVSLSGTRFDCGSVEGYLKAINFYSVRHNHHHN